MACNDCSPNIEINYDSPWSNPVGGNFGCQEESNGGTSSSNSEDITYNGPNLACSGAESGDPLDDVLQKIDGQICSVLGDYSTYNTYCLSNITTEKEFVETISGELCTLKDDFNDFVNNTYANEIITINASIDDLDTPDIHSNCTNIFSPNSSDTLKQTLQKISNSLCTINNDILDLSSVNWGNCYTVPTTPTNIGEGFDVLLDQICLLKSEVENSSPSTVIIDNSGSCLAGGTANDSLLDTIGLIKTRLCKTGTFDGSLLDWSCLNTPTLNSDTDIQTAFQSLISEVKSLKQATPTFDSNFTTTVQGCDGIKVSLADEAGTDHYVATNDQDTTPGTLADKLEEGSNIDLDYTTDPGKVIISSTGGSNTDEKVKAFSGDTDPSGYLEDKLEGSTSGDIQINVTENTGANKLTIDASVDSNSLLQTILEELDSLDTSDALFQLFCSIKGKCPDPCGTVNDVEVIYDNN